LTEIFSLQTYIYRPDTDPYTSASFYRLSHRLPDEPGENRKLTGSGENILAFKELIGLHPADDIQWPPNRPATVDVPFN